jgi:hypothetical protein
MGSERIKRERESEIPFERRASNVEWECARYFNSLWEYGGGKYEMAFNAMSREMKTGVEQF